MSERIALARSRRYQRHTGWRLRRRLCTAEDGESFFDVSGQRIFYRLPGTTGGEEAAIDGAMLILREAFVDPHGFFHGPVSVRPGDVVLDLGGNIGQVFLAVARSGPGLQLMQYAFKAIRVTLAESYVL